MCERLSQIVNLLFIRLKVEKNLFSKTGDLKIKCTATIDPIYWKSNEESIQGFQERSYINFWNSGIVNNRSKDNFSLTINFQHCIPATHKRSHFHSQPV